MLYNNPKHFTNSQVDNRKWFYHVKGFSNLPSEGCSQNGSFKILFDLISGLQML